MKKLIRNSTAEFLIFTSQAGDDSIEVRVEDETVWLTQKLIAELFGKSVSTINEHIKNIYNDAGHDYFSGLSSAKPYRDPLPPMGNPAY